MRRFWTVRASSFIVFFLFGMLLLAGAFIFMQTAERQAYQAFHESKQRDEALRFAGRMVESGITSGPFSEEQREWLRREASLYRLAIRYESLDGSVVWIDDLPASFGGEAEASQRVRTPLVQEGAAQGVLTAAYLTPLNGDGIPESGYRRANDDAMRLFWIIGTLACAAASLALSRWQSRMPARLARHAERVRLGETAIESPVRGALEWRALGAALNELAVRLDQQEGVRRRLLQDLTHEFRTPVTSMITELEAIVDGLYPVDERRLKDMYNELERLGRLIADMEQLFDAEGARFKLNVERCDLVQVIRDVYRNFLPYAKEQGVSIRFVHPHRPCFAEVDQDRIVQMAINLLTNAMKFLRDGVPGAIELGVAEIPDDDSLVSFYCEDNGIGVAQGDLSSIFERFFRANRFGKHRKPGFGVGLSICKTLAEAHDGSIQVHSRLGHGSRFVVTIPTVYRRSADR